MNVRYGELELEIIYIYIYITRKYVLLFNFFFFLIFWPYRAACGILVPQPGIEPMPPPVEAQSLNHWTAREAPYLTISTHFLHS